ncbi:hypothetical protein WH47_03997 [Habropoda laboriosa]|uniref:Uncharacterized protein n=1 Tax=Habropoda laboriosa TaxID=597456 RepID=A0A0L7QUJ9_9HYME|nr:hypothetical protein WH47_03997 [Habropoda laboriosa]
MYHVSFESISEEDEIKRKVFQEPFWSIYWPGEQTLTRFIARHDGTRIYLADSERHGLTENFKKSLKILKGYSLPDVRKENHGYDRCNVYEFCV